MAVYYVSSASGVTQYAKNTAYAQGDRVVLNTSDTGSNYQYARPIVWECTTAGTTHASNFPTWVSTIVPDVTTVTSGGATFTARKSGFSSGTTASWSFANIFLYYMLNGSVGLSNRPYSGTDIVYISSSHSETWPTATYIDWSPGTGSDKTIFYLSVDDAAAPPTALEAGAAITCATGDIQHDHWGYIYGFTFTSPNEINCTASSLPIFDTCTFHLNHTTADKYVHSGTSTGTSGFTSSRYLNCVFRFGAISQGLMVGGIDNISDVYLIGCSLHASSSAISRIVYQDATYSGYSAQRVYMDNCDWSVAATAVRIGGYGTYMRNCKLPASWSGTLHGGAQDSAFDYRSEMYATDSENTNYRIRMEKPFGTITDEHTLVRTGGATDGTNAISWKLVTTAAVFPVLVLRSPEIVRRNTNTGSQLTATVEILHDSATALTDAEVWLEVRYFGDANSSLGSLTTDRKGILDTAADQTTSSETWTTTGMSNPNKQKLSVTFTPQKAGFVHAVVCVAKSSKTLYVDPVLTLA